MGFSRSPRSTARNNMKKEVPAWVVISSIVVVVLIGGFFIMRAIAGPPDLPAPRINVKPELPERLKGKLSPEMEKQAIEQAKKYGGNGSDAAGAPTAPTAPPSGN